MEWLSVFSFNSCQLSIVSKEVFVRPKRVACNIGAGEFKERS